MMGYDGMMDVLSKLTKSRWGTHSRLVTAGIIAGLLLGLAIARLPLLYAAGFVTGMVTAAGIVLDPILGLAGAMVAGPLWAWLMLQPWGIPANVGQYILLLFFILTGVRSLLRRKTSIALPPLLLPLAAFLMIGLLSLWQPVDTWLGFTEWAKWVQLALVFVLVYDDMSLRSPGKGPVFMLVFLTGSALVQAGIGLWQFALRGDGPEPFAISGRFYRAYGTFMQPNPYAGFVAMAAALLVGMSFILIITYVKKEPAKPALKWLVIATVCAVILTLGVVASWSRGGWLGFGAAVLVMVFLTPVKRWQGVLLIALACLALWLVAMAGVLPSGITDRITSLLTYTNIAHIRSVGITDANFSSIERLAHWHAAL
ncbi:MAG: hypothetical protein P1S60_05370, partial [Anaerolineae bacterium]|nr:hypothetical protein [Anaerolineae bacterium]